MPIFLCRRQLKLPSTKAVMLKTAVDKINKSLVAISFFLLWLEKTQMSATINVTVINITINTEEIRLG